MEQKTKALPENTTSDIKFITTLKPGVLDLRPYYDFGDGENLPDLDSPVIPWKRVISEEMLLTSLSAEFLKCPKEVKSIQKQAFEQKEIRYFDMPLNTTLMVYNRTERPLDSNDNNDIQLTTRECALDYKLSRGCYTLSSPVNSDEDNDIKKTFDVQRETKTLLQYRWKNMVFNADTANYIHQPSFNSNVDKIITGIFDKYKNLLPNYWAFQAVDTYTPQNTIETIPKKSLSRLSTSISASAPPVDLIEWNSFIRKLETLATFICCTLHPMERLILERCITSKEQSAEMSPDTWLSGGSLGSRSATLVFRSSALANTSDASTQSKPGHKLHVTYRVVQAETKLLAKLLECHGIQEAPLNSNDFNLLWTGSHPKPGVLRSMGPHQRVNHFPRSYELTRKDRLYKNIEKMQHAKGIKHFDFIPQTFLMPTEYKELCSSHHRVKGPWIVKPAASSRGRGIYIVESPNQVPLEEPVVVAKYISKPLLVRGHKCDLRLYVAVTSFDPMIVYIYEEGMVRFATVKYDMTHKQLWNPCMHLCNYSINKYHSDYVKSDDPSAENVGHKWTLSALLRHLKSLGKDTGLLMSQVEDLVVKAILACGNSIITACKMFVPNVNNCFELYGFDILIDENLKPWLLEVNLSPSLGCDSPLDVRLKSAMLSDLLTLVGIPAVDPVLRPTASPSHHSSKNLTKMKLSNCRRVHSADGLSNTLPKKSGTNTTLSNITLTHDDLKMIRNAKNQFERRGGFVRIFPAVDSWSKYSQYLEPVTGIPIAGSTCTLPFTMMSQHNNNQILYMQLFPEIPITAPVLRNDKLYVRHSLDRKRDSSLDSVRRPEVISSTPRQDRYERKLSQGHRSSLTAPKKALKETHSAELRRQVCEMMKNGKRMSQVEVRKAFSQYLACVLRRITSSPDQEGHVEIVLKFLQKASTYLKNPFNVKIPSHKLSDKDRAAIVAKQLNDFLYLYNRETELYADLSRPSQIPRNLFSEFLEYARESDLEEVLVLQNIHTVPNKGNQGTVSSFQVLLRCLPHITSSTCFRQPETGKKTVKVTPLS